MKRFIILNVVIMLFLLSCGGDNLEYFANVRFVDSTFLNDKESYKSNEVIYVLASEQLQAEMPDTTKVLIESSLGDREFIECTLWLYSPIPEIRGHRGQIMCHEASLPTQNNGTLDVKYTEDTLFVSYTVHNEKAFDTAFIDPYH